MPLFCSPVKDISTSVAMIVMTTATPAVKFTVQCQGANERLGDREEAYALQQLAERASIKSWGGMPLTLQTRSPKMLLSSTQPDSAAKETGASCERSHGGRRRAVDARVAVGATDDDQRGKGR
eukprot:5868571-Prymnesium_polylepis.2